MIKSLKTLLVMLSKNWLDWLKIRNLHNINLNFEQKIDGLFFKTC